MAKIIQDIARSAPTGSHSRRGNLVVATTQVFNHAAEVVTVNMVFEKAAAALGLAFSAATLAKHSRVTKLSRGCPL